ncbi:hypothetical protein C0Q70_08492 [Pomacea canaliculata]|uniref:G-protein coupled receptors family 1 profile domain-containing protein n=1 Tax=Pomacea canaliculata TaxID=400727 RepID=A0A2T7PI07_POMCA|nr:hypothetical protein C0Q70_08492 [Pomacea canaliculata]
MSTFWATCPLFGWGDYDVEPFGTSCTLKWSSTDSSYVTSVFMGCLVVPLGVMSLSYGCILNNTLRASRRLRQYRPNCGPRRTRHELRLIKV